MSRMARAAQRIREEISLLSLLRDYGYHVHEDGGDHEQQFSCDLHGDGSDSKPSARYYPDNNRFFCFACGRSRDAIALVCEKEGLQFWDAVRLLETKYGLPPLPWAPEDEERTPAQALTQDLAETFSSKETLEQVMERLGTFLMGLCRDRALTPTLCAGFWEAHDRVGAFISDQGDPVKAMEMARHILERAKLALQEGHDG